MLSILRFAILAVIAARNTAGLTRTKNATTLVGRRLMDQHTVVNRRRVENLRGHITPPGTSKEHPSGASFIIIGVEVSKLIPWKTKIFLYFYIR